MNANIGSIIKRTRQKQNLQQQELAKMASISNSMLSTIESGQSSPSKDIIERIFTALRHKLIAIPIDNE